MNDRSERVIYLLTFFNKFSDFGIGNRELFDVGRVVFIVRRIVFIEHPFHEGYIVHGQKR